jgi:hypothetical protein
MAKDQPGFLDDSVGCPLPPDPNGSAPAPTRIAGRRCLAIVVFFGAVVAALAAANLSGRPANALPLYARQTGQPCAACHTAFPELTPFGRRFKLGGYTLGGGDSSVPFSGLLQPSFPHSDASQPTNAAPQPGAGNMQAAKGSGGGRRRAAAGAAATPPPNDEVVLEQAAIFTGGRITDTLGAFVRATYDHASDAMAWDNTDLRYADSGKLADHDLTWGVTINNDPTVQDVWNTIATWRFPYHVKHEGGGGMTPTSLEGDFGRRSVGVGGYAFLDDLLYVELSGYRSLTSGAQHALGIDPRGANAIDGFAPYWRLAIEPIFGQHSIEVGTFGLKSDIFPMQMSGAGTNATTDLGVDSQYQWLADENAVTVRGSWIHESRGLRASKALGLADNSHDTLRSLHVSASYIYDSTWSLTAERFAFGGTRDAALYRNATGTPIASGWTAEIAYLPFMHGGPSFYPWLNMRIGLQYTINDQNPHNNTLLLYSLILF